MAVTNQELESLLIPLYLRAVESQRPEALLKDERAEQLIRQIDYDFTRLAQSQVDEATRIALILRNRQFDFYARDFLTRHPPAVIVHLGCGLDTRFERVDNGAVEWYDLDLPNVIALRRQFIGSEKSRYHLIDCSVLDAAWLEAVNLQRPTLLLAEGIFMFLNETPLKSLILTLQNKFPGAELVFDAFSPFFVWANNRRVARTGIGARCQWAIKNGRELERWSRSIRFIDEWFPFAQAEPRLGKVRWVGRIPLLAQTMGIYRYRI